MLKISPKLPYKGLTIIMSRPSRNDSADLLSSNGGYFFKQEALRPEINIMQCETRLKDDNSPLLPNTKVILLLGNEAFQQWTDNTKDLSLGEARGSIFYYQSIPCIPSFSPQDAVDIKDYESQFNAAEGEASSVSDDSDSADDAMESKSRKGKTRRPNYSFWLKADTKKALRILANDGAVPEPLYKPIYKIYPDLDECIDVLRNTKGKYLYMDIETPITDVLKEKVILCKAFSFGINEPIYVVPYLDHNYKPAYDGMEKLLLAFAVAYRDNTVIAWNGAQFDYLVEALNYKLPIVRAYDAMLAQHRIFPEPEKSLGHATSLATYEPFHKDESDFRYNTPERCQSLWKYCGKDVYTMVLIHNWQTQYAKTIPGLTQSIQQVMDSIRPYLTITLQGLRFDEQKRAAMISENDRLMNHYLKWLDYLISPEWIKKIRGTGKSALPTSNKQCCEYFHKILDYPVVARGKMTKKGTRNPSLAKSALYKLRLKQENPTIDICLAYRNKAHDSSQLTFQPWIIPDAPQTSNREEHTDTTKSNTQDERYSNTKMDGVHG